MGLYRLHYAERAVRREVYRLLLLIPVLDGLPHCFATHHLHDLVLLRDLTHRLTLDPALLFDLLPVFALVQIVALHIVVDFENGLANLRARLRRDLLLHLDWLQINRGLVHHQARLGPVVEELLQRL